MPRGSRLRAALLVLAIGSACALRTGNWASFISLQEAYDGTPPGSVSLLQSRDPRFRRITTAYEDPQGNPERDVASRWKNCDRNRSLAKDVDLDVLEPLAPALAGKHVRVFGDSMMGELTRALDEMVRRPKLFQLYADFVPLLPHQREDLLEMLDTKREVTVFAIGVWYNWAWETPHLNHTSITPDNTAKLVAARCKPLPPFKEHSAYGHARRECKADDWEAYVSDLKRLASVVHELKGKDPTHRFIVKSVPPQFFNGPGGNWAGVQTKCVPITPDKRPLAELRNSIAREILGSSGDFEFVDTFGEELEFWGLHAPGEAKDCTHYCNPSAGTWLPARELLKQIALR